MSAQDLEVLYNALCQSRVAYDGVGYYIRLSIEDRERLASGIYKMMKEKRAVPNQYTPLVNDLGKVFIGGVGIGNVQGTKPL